MKRLILGILSLGLVSYVYASPSTSITVPNSFTPNTVIQSSKVNDNNSEIQSKYNSHNHTDITQVGTITAGGWNGTVITPQYGGTGQNFSASSSGSIIMFNAAGTMTTIPPGSDGQSLVISDVSPKWQGGIIQDIILTGAEVSATTLTTDVSVYPGKLYNGTNFINLTTITILGLTTGGDYVSGSVVSYAGGEGWNYIGVSTGSTVKLLGDCPPEYESITSAVSTNPSVLLYSNPQDNGDIYKFWRIIGAVRQNTSNSCANGFIQNGNMIMVDVPITLTTAISAGWSGALSCATGMPLISNSGIFGLTSTQAGGGSAAGIWIRPNNSTWSTNFSNGIYIGADSANPIIGEQRVCITDEFQQIQYYNDGSDTATRITIEGYYLNIR